jgi:hypothetical protein
VLALQTNSGTTAVTIDTSQNVGIGVVPSTWTLYDRVFQLGSSSSFYTYQQTELNISTNQYYNGGSKYLGTGASARYQQSAGAHVWYYAGSGTAGGAVSYTESMRIDSSGNVGIGATSPGSKLHVYAGNVSTLGAVATSGLTIGNGGSNNNLCQIGLGYPGTYQPTAISAITTTQTGYCISDLVFATRSVNTDTAPTERMRIDSSGNAYFQYGGATQNGAPSGINLTGPASTQLQFYMLKSTQVEAHFGFKSSTDTNLYVGTGGGMSGIGIYGLYQANTSNTWTAVSDLRFKTELEPVSNALEKVANVRTVTGRYTHDEENGVTRRRPFLIAQDFVDALPEAVDQQDPEKLGLSYSDTVVLAFAAIKELKAINDQQAETINALTARIVALEAK